MSKFLYTPGVGKVFWTLIKNSGAKKKKKKIQVQLNSNKINKIKINKNYARYPKIIQLSNQV